MVTEAGFEHKFSRFGEMLTVQDDSVIQGYASLFDEADQGGDRVAPGAYGASLQRLNASGCRVKMLWQHDPTQPIGVWEELREDSRGLWVKGRLLTEIARGAEAAALIAAGAIEGLSIGYRTKRAQGRGRRARAHRSGALGGLFGDLSDAANRAGDGPKIRRRRAQAAATGG